jgi:acyl-CoA reductase-like NAD-dependent aldehyde dehydrogenase
MTATPTASSDRSFSAPSGLPAPAAGGASPARLECRNPATLERLGEVTVHDRAQVVAAVERARRAQPAWGRASYAERRRVMAALLEYTTSHQDEICRAAVRDSGKTMLDAVMGEIFPVCEKLRYTIAEGERDLAPETRAPGILMHKTARVEYHPLGVIGVIAPWNFPFHNIFCPLVPALFAGNAVVVKVSELASGSAAYYQSICDQVLEACGHSRDLVQILTGAGETGSALCTSGVDKVFFTGSPENGRRVMEAASHTLTPVVLELGGKDPMIICDDADLDQAVSAALLGVFTACGQMCVAAERLYVFDAIHDEFVRRVVEKVSSFRQGPTLDADGRPAQVDVGATTMPRQLAIIEAQVQDAVQKGARVLCGGRRNPNLPGQFFEPTVVVDADHTMRLVREETFGPVMTILRVRDEEEAVRLANDTSYGLGSSVFTRDSRRAGRIASRLSAGMTVVNDYGVAYMAQSLPFGGVRASGFGRINGREGLRACCHTKAVVGDRFPIHMAYPIYPVRPGSYELVTDLVGMLYGPGIGGRVRSVVRGVKRLAGMVLG